MSEKQFNKEAPPASTDPSIAPASPIPVAEAACDIPSVTICITTHNRVDCARIGMEIIRYNFPAHWRIVHACSATGYERYLEDELVRRDPRALSEGALNLLQSGMNTAASRFHSDYIVHIEGDTWILDYRVLVKYLNQLGRDKAALIAASSWSYDKAQVWARSRRWKNRFKWLSARVLRALGGHYGQRGMRSLATQFFIIKNDTRMLQAIHDLRVNPDQFLEETFYERVAERFGKGAIIGMPEREPVHPHHRWICEALTLYGQHWPETLPNPKPDEELDPATHIGVPGKRETLQQHTWLKGGPHMERLLTSSDLSYYNTGARRS